MHSVILGYKNKEFKYLSYGILFFVQITSGSKWKFAS